MSSLATTNQGFSPANLTEAMAFSEMLAKSSMVPKAYQGKPEDVIVAVQWGKELGLAPLQALQNIACINGKPSVYGDAAMALVQNSNVCDGIEEYFEGEGTPNPVAVCVAHRKHRTPVTAKFSVEDAKRAGLWGKSGPWQAYPKRMLQMRARGFALRDAFPDVLKGLITVEEAEDYPDEAKPAKQAPKMVMRNPLDAIRERHPAEALPVPQSPVVIPAEMPVRDESHALDAYNYVANAPGALDDVNAQLAEASTLEPELSDSEPVILETPAEECVIETTPPETVGDWPLHIPGKDNQLFPDYESWSAAYEGLADKVTRAGRTPHRDRMTKLRELREANEDIMQRIPALERVKHTASYSKRLALLGAKMSEEGDK